MTTVTTLPVGKSIQAVACNPVTNLVYAADAQGNELAVLDGNNGYQVKTKFPVGNTPYSLAVNTDKNLVYVLCQNMPSNFARDANSNPLSFIQVIDGATNKITGQIDFDNSIPMQIALNPKTGVLYSAGTLLAKIVNNQIEKSITIGSCYSVAADSVSNHVYVVYLGPKFQFYVARFDGDTLAFIDQTVLQPNGDGVAVNTTINQVYTTCIGPYNMVQVWNPASSPPSAVTTVQTGGYPQHVAVNENNQHYYTNNYFDSTVSVINASNNQPYPEVSVGDSPYDVAVDPVRSMVFTANFNGTVSVFNDAY